MKNGRTKRQEQAAARREQLLKTAFQLFSERGYRDTSVRDIARTLGVTEGLLYHYFAGKADLFVAVLNEYAPPALFESIIATAANRPLAEVLQEIGQTFLTLIQQRRSFALTILAEAPTDPELGAMLGLFVRRISERLASLLKHYQVSGQIAPTVNIETAAQAFLGSLILHFLSTTIFSPADTAPTNNHEQEQTVRHLVHLFLRGLLPRSS
ncbi:MAG: TetR/AcrR family transcriptional regulator [Ktedonobacteraceae bacterium]|nr:TetR/AcrR family transcriptional regulator [Ktedonobacteraceae bacterium]